VQEQESWRVPGVRDENHFVHAVPAGPTQDEWIYGGVFRCRWVRVRGDTPVFGEHGALLRLLVRTRVVAYVTRGRQLLVFDHEGITQVPAGRIDAHESLATGLAREVEEETGLSGVRIVRELAGPDEIARLYDVGGQPNHAFHAVTDVGTPEAWEHEVTGTGMDSGFVFRCRWVSLDECPPLWGKPDPLVERLRASITES
jgi:8-oxo-dGTP pyrophosphatase MutT (NUDIX family)